MSLASSLDSRQSKESAQYQLALKHYYHRSFSKSLKVLSSLLENPVTNLTLDINNEEWLPSAYKLYLTLCGMALREIKAHALTQMSSPTHRLQFPQYLQLDNDQSKKMADKLKKDMETGEFFKLIYELGLVKDQSCLSCCLEIEIEHNVDVEWQIGHILKSQPISQSAEVLKVYLSKEVLPIKGKDAVKDKVSRLFALESEQVVEEWLRWADGLENSSTNESEFDYENSDQLLNESDYGYVEDVEHDLNEEEYSVEENIVPEETSPNFETPQKPRNKTKKRKKRKQQTHGLKDYVIRFFKQHMGIDIAAKYKELIQMLTLLCAILTILVLISTGKRLIRYKTLRNALSRARDTIQMAFKVSYV